MESMENRVERDSKKPMEESSTGIGSYGGGGASGIVAWLGAKVREKELEQPPCIGFRLGKNGVEEVLELGSLSDYEKENLESLKPELKSSIEKGFKYINQSFYKAKIPSIIPSEHVKGGIAVNFMQVRLSPVLGLQIMLKMLGCWLGPVTWKYCVLDSIASVCETCGSWDTYTLKRLRNGHGHRMIRDVGAYERMWSHDGTWAYMTLEMWQVDLINLENFVQLGPWEDTMDCKQLWLGSHGCGNDENHERRIEMWEGLEAIVSSAREHHVPTHTKARLN
uniref:Lactate/malate dehydrogenase C-terminal domain-containing protein n=1 Tax=Fagus sylvatica TaxID=28930 RepID=A0A2N9FRQ2_FAGSY